MTDDPTITAAHASVPYATPAPRSARVWAGAAIAGAGLALLGLGGCFLIGVLSIVSPVMMSLDPTPAPDLTGPQTVLMVLLYVLAFGCFAGGATLLFGGTRSLLRVTRG